MPIERQQVQGLGGVQVLKASARTVDRTPGKVGVDPGQDVGGILNTLVQAAGSTMQAVGTHLQTKIEEDKIRQMNNAFLGLQPSDDATKAGYRAHAVVGMQNSVLASTKRLSKEAETFEGTDEEWAAKVVESRTIDQDVVEEKYPSLAGDPEALRVMTTLYNEQAPQLAASRIAGKMKQEQIKREGEFADALLMRADSLEGDELTASLDAAMGTMRKSLGLTEAATEGMLVKAAMEASASGDDKLMEYTKLYKGDNKTSLFQRTGKLQKQNEAAEKLKIMEDQSKLAKDKEAIATAYLSGEITTDEMYVATREHNKANMGIPWNERQIRDLIHKRQKALVQQTDDSELLADMDAGTREGGDPFTQKYGDKKTRKRGVELARARSEASVQRTLNNLPEDQQTPEVERALKKRADRQLADLLMVNGSVNEEWSAKFKSLITLPFEASDTVDKLPKIVTDTLDIWYSLPESSRAAHTTDPKTAAFMDNFEGGLRLGLTGPQSLDRAQRASRSTRTISKKERADIEKYAEDATDDVANRWFATDTPEWFANKIGREILSGVITSVEAGSTDPERAAQLAKANFMNNYTRLENGQLMFGSRASLAKRMKVHPDDIEDTLEAYLSINKQALEDEAMGADTSEMYFDVIPHRGTVVVRSLDGHPLTAPMPLEKLREGTDVFREGKADLVSADQSAAYGTGLVGSKYGEALGKAQGSMWVRKEIPLGATKEYDLFNNYVGAMAQVENSVRAGFDKSTGAWYPHESLEGGTDTIAYGHKLTKPEEASGVIVLSTGKQYRFRQGESQITDKTATIILEDDLRVARLSVQKRWKGFNDLPLKYQKVLEAIEYNTKQGAKQADWPKLKAAMASGSDKQVRKHMITSYKPKGSNKFIPLKERAEQLADALGLDK